MGLMSTNTVLADLIGYIEYNGYLVEVHLDREGNRVVVDEFQLAPVRETDVVLSVATAEDKYPEWFV